MWAIESLGTIDLSGCMGNPVNSETSTEHIMDLRRQTNGHSAPMAVRPN